MRLQFDLIDRDGDGSVTGAELTHVMRRLGNNVTDVEIAAIMAEVDADDDGNITFEEFVSTMSVLRRRRGPAEFTENSEEMLRDAFRVFDKHGRGFIGPSDLRLVLHSLGQQLTDDEIEDMIADVDVDGDGRIDFFEFVKAISDDFEGETTAE